jgi:hypothetical protein
MNGFIAQHQPDQLQSATVSSAPYVHRTLAGIGDRYIGLCFGVSALNGAIVEISELPDSVDQEDRATDYAKHSAKEFLKQSIVIQPIAFGPSIEQFEGDLLIKWQLKQKITIAIFPASPQSTVRLYRKGSDGRSIYQNQATALDLVNSINWMLSANSSV